MAQADWYVPSISNAADNLPEGLFITMFDEKNHVNEGLTSEQIKKEYERNAKAVGEYVLCLSPDRLALHETIVAMSLNLKFSSEDDFIEKFHKIYQEAVLPKIQDKENYFEKMSVLRRRLVEQNAQKYFSKQPVDNYSDLFSHYDSCFEKNLERYNQRINELDEQFSRQRPTRAEREEMKELKQITQFMNENKERIIVDLVANAENLRENKRLVEAIISGKDGVFDSNYIEQFDKLTQHDKDTRQSFLIVGGAASGKGSVTNAVKNEQPDKNDLLEINPDLYKKLLLPYEKIGDNIEFHAALTHAESSIVFDSIAERWQDMARKGEAPNILMDVVRAGKWQLDVLGTADTKISVNTPMLPVTVALERCYQRGVQTGRYVPTKELISGHKEQVFANKNAMKRGINYRFYNTNIKYGEEAPLVANFDAKQSKMTIYDMGVMWDYFSKSQLNPDARSAEDLSFASPKTTAKEIIEHTEFMDIAIQDKDGLIVALAQREEKAIFSIKDFDRLVDNMGKENAINMLIGMKQNDVEIRADEQVLNLVNELMMQNSAKQEQDTSQNIDINCQQYADLLEHLVNDGIRVGKTENAYIYDFANDEELKDKKLTIGTQNLDIISQEASMASINEYDPSQEAKKQKVLIIDAKVYNTAAKREQLIERMRMMLKTTGKFEAEGIYMNERRKINDDYIFNNSGKAEVQVAKPNPDATRIAYKIEDKAVKIPVQWGEYAIEKDGSIVIREKDMPELKRALSNYQKDKNPMHLLETDGRAKIDVYGTDPFFVEDNYSYVFSETEYRNGINKLIAEGTVMEPKNSTKYDSVIAYQIKSEDKIVLPDGNLLKTGDWLCMPKNELDRIQKQLDNGQLVTGIYSIKQNTMQKSYNMSRTSSHGENGRE
ncbi:MAG: zeta toxin family protein [Alphaproteobacteria bacterium]|nr:zeta toxin family protein [Alphaproteobacteria bacterium]